MRIKVRRQEALCVFYREKDDGKFFAVCCAYGLMEALGRKVKRGEEILIDLDVKEISELNPEFK